MKQRALMFAGLAALGVAWIPSCKKDSESLILVRVSADSRAGTLTSLTLAAPGATRTYALSGLSTTPMEFGLYVPQAVTGEVNVMAKAQGPGGCEKGYSGKSGAVKIDSPGATTTPASIIMMPDNVCEPDAGSGGGAGGGQAGSGSAGTGQAGGGAGGSGEAGSGFAGGGFAGGGSGGSSQAGSGAGGNGQAGSGAGASGQAGSGSGGSGQAGSGQAGNGSAGNGSAGSTGMGGAGTCTGASPPVGTPPAFNCCQQYDHEADCATDAYIYTVGFSPDGRMVMSGGDDGRVRLWNFDGKTLTVAATLSNAGYGYGAFSPDGKLVAVGLESGEIDIWAVGALTAAPTKLFVSGDTSYGIAFTPDSQRLISIDSASLYVHSVITGQMLATTVVPVSNYALAVSPVVGSGVLGIAVAGSDGLAAVYKLTGQSTLNTPVVLDINADAVLSTAFSPDGVLVAFGDYDSLTRFWTYPVSSASAPPNGTNIAIDPTFYQTVNGLAFSPNGNYLAIAGGYPGSVSVWTVSARTLLSRRSITDEYGLSVAFSPTGNVIVVGEKGCGKVLLCTE